MLACGIVILGVVPPDELRGADAVTAVTYPDKLGKVLRAPVPSIYCDVVPAPVTPIVPFDVKGLLDTVNADGIERPTDVSPLSNVFGLPSAPIISRWS
jgi:hypothetical protein